MDCEKVWSVNDIVKNRTNWSLSADSELLKHLQLLSKNIIAKSKSTLKLLESFESDVDQACLSVTNMNNRFKSLSDTQFIENKIQESPETEMIVTEEAEEFQNKNTETVSNKLKEAVNNGLSVLSTHYDIITVSDSDSENEEPQEILLKSCNPFMKRRLPYIIGSDDFTKFDHLGMADSSSDDEEEDECTEEVIEEEQPYYKVTVPSSKDFSNIAHTQIIQISSSDSDDSDVSISKNSQRHYVGSTVPKSVGENQSSPMLPHAFADHLNAALLEADIKRPSEISHCSNSFSPPPFPIKNNFSSDEEKSDSDDSVSSRGPVISLSSSSNTAFNSNCNKSNVEVIDDLFSKESASKPSEYNEYAKNKTSEQENHSNEFSHDGLNSELNTDSNSSKEKKLSRALANEFKSTILAKKSSTSRNCSLSENNLTDPKPTSTTLSTVTDSGDVSVGKVSQTRHHNFHLSCKVENNHDKSDIEPNLSVSSNQDPSHSTPVFTVATESSKSSWLPDKCGDGDDDDDEDSDDWFSRAVSSKICDVKSKTTSNYSEPAPGNNLDKTVEKVTTDSKTVLKTKNVDSQTKESTIQVDGTKKRYSLFGSDSDDDDDNDTLFTKKASTTSDKNKTNELYEILFNDSDADDPIEALVKENKRRIETNNLTKSEIVDSKISNVRAKSTEIFEKNSSTLGIDNEFKPDKEKLIVNFEKENPDAKKKSTGPSNINFPPFTKASNVNYGNERNIFTSSVLETDENISSPKIVAKSETAKILSSDFPSDESSKISHHNDPIDYYDVNFENNEISSEEVKSMSIESFLKSNSNASEKTKPHLLSARTIESSKPELDFVKTNVGEPIMNAIEKIKVDFENPNTESVNSDVCSEMDGDIERLCSQQNPDNLLEPSDSLFRSEDDASKHVNLNDQVLSHSFAATKVKSLGKQSSTFRSPRNSSDRLLESPSKDVSEKFKIAVSSSENGSNTSEILIDTDNVTSSKEENIINEKASFSTKTKPGKLAAGRGANVNINALLPTSKWSKPIEKINKTEDVTLVDEEDDVPKTTSKLVPTNLSSATKDRVKIPAKRRPPSRRGRKAQINVSSFLETSVEDNIVPPSEDLNFSVQSSKAVTTFNYSAEKSHLKITSNVNSADRVNDNAEISFKNTSYGETSSIIGIDKDVDSIFDDIFHDGESRNIVSTKISAIDSAIQSDNPSNLRDPCNESREQLVESLSNESAVKNKYSSPENNSNYSSITDYKTIESPKLSDKSSLLFNSFDDNNIPEENTSVNAKSNEHFKILGEINSIPKIGKEQENNSSSSTKIEAGKLSVPRVKSDIFADGDDDDEDFNKLFSALKKPLKSLSSKKYSLFEDDDDDGDLFGIKTSSQQRNESALTKKKSLSKTEKPRAMKLHSELVLGDDDPLTTSIKRV